MKKTIIYISVVAIFLMFMSIFFLGDGSYAVDYEEDKVINLKLIYDDNDIVFNSRVFEYIDLIDDSLFISMDYHNYDFNLNEDYSFMSRFAIAFIVNNIEFYDNYIKKFEDSNNLYVDLNLVYEITNLVFEKKDYLITNDDLIIKSDYISLPKIDTLIDMKLEKINDIREVNNAIYVDVTYKNIEYLYTYEFKIINKHLILVSVDIGEV